MDTVLILYGSRARGDARPGADTDIIAAEAMGDLGRPREVNGVSVHRYPQPWLLKEAHSGNLFIFHVANEGIPLLDDSNFLSSLKSNFRLRSSYSQEILVADRIIRALLNEDWGFNYEIARRYFWAIRTVLICRTAELGRPVFGAKALEEFSDIRGLENHINNRATESFERCERFGNAVTSGFGVPFKDMGQQELLSWLEGSSDIGRDTIRLLQTREAVELSGFSLYM